MTEIRQLTSTKPSGECYSSSVSLVPSRGDLRSLQRRGFESRLVKATAASISQHQMQPSSRHEWPLQRHDLGPAEVRRVDLTDSQESARGVRAHLSEEPVMRVGRGHRLTARREKVLRRVKDLEKSKKSWQVFSVNDKLRRLPMIYEMNARTTELVHGPTSSCSRSQSECPSVTSATFFTPLDAVPLFTETAQATYTAIMYSFFPTRCITLRRRDLLPR